MCVVVMSMMGMRTKEVTLCQLWRVECRITFCRTISGRIKFQRWVHLRVDSVNGRFFGMIGYIDCEVEMRYQTSGEKFCSR